jgi:phosphatidate cytidylyltransferase
MVCLDNPVLYWAWKGVISLLLGATLIAWFFHRFRPSNETQRTKLRIRTWWLIAICLFAAMSFGVTGIALLFLAISLLAFREFVFLDSRLPRQWQVWLVLSLGSTLYFLGLAFTPLRYPVWMLACAGLLAVGLSLRFIMGSWKTTSLALAAFLFGAIGLGFVVRLAQFHCNAPITDDLGLRLCFFLLVLTSLNDVAQYLWGKGIGRTKVVPRISPNKTWAGLIGGVMTTALLASLVAPWFTPFGWGRGLLVGAVMGFGGFLGDIMVSAFKRHVGAGDSGTCLPGHGGILDRIDSLCVTAPLLYGLVRYY